MIRFIGNDGLIGSEAYEKASLQECIDWLSGLTEVNLDTETEGHFDHKKRILMVQLNWQDITYVLDARYVDISQFKRLEDILVVGQNLKFDYKFLKFHGITLNNIYDTMLAECCLTNGHEVRSLGLAHLADKYCGIKLNKSIRGQFTNINGDPFTEQQIMYGVGDVTCLTQIKDSQLKVIAEKDMSGWVQRNIPTGLMTL